MHYIRAASEQGTYISVEGRYISWILRKCPLAHTRTAAKALPDFNAFNRHGTHTLLGNCGSG